MPTADVEDKSLQFISSDTHNAFYSIIQLFVDNFAHNITVDCGDLAQESRLTPLRLFNTSFPGVRTLFSGSGRCALGHVSCD